MDQDKLSEALSVAITTGDVKATANILYPGYSGAITKGPIDLEQQIDGQKEGLK